jgi:hypothetical protein
LQKAKGKSNAQSLFGMQKIPSDNHIRNLMDVVHRYENCIQQKGNKVKYFWNLGTGTKQLPQVGA